jgi:succinyl-diaminopimelate desuccinylase
MAETLTITTIFEKIDTYRDEIIALQKDLTAIPALGAGSGGIGEVEKAELIKRYMEKIGFDSLEEHKAPDPSVPCGYRPNLIYRFRGNRSDRTIWIMSHMDIVPPGEEKHWSSKPYEIKVDGDLIYGRGVEDNQQGIVSSILAVKALREAGVKPEFDVALLFIADEETGSKFGIQYLLKELPDLFRSSDIIIVPDGGDEEGTMVEVAEKSVMWVKFTTLGKQTHASRPETGVNAHRAAASLIMKMGRLHDIYDAKDPVFIPPISTFEPTKKENNVPNINTIPGEDVFYLDCRVLPPYDLKDVIKTIDGMCREVEKESGVTISYEFPQMEQAAPATPADAPVVKALAAAVKDVYHKDSVPMGIGGGTVGAFIRRAGYFAAVWCRTDELAHQPNEYCKISNTLGDAKVFAHVFLQK